MTMIEEVSSHSASTFYGLPCPFYSTICQTPKAETGWQTTVTSVMGHGESIQFRFADSVSGIPNLLRLSPGISTPFIDLTGDDEVSEINEEQRKQDYEPGNVSDLTTVEETESVPFFDAGLATPGFYRSIALQLGELLPVAQPGSLGSAITSSLNLNPLQKKEYRESIPRLCPTPSPSPKLYNIPANDFEFCVASQAVPDTPPQRLPCRERKRIIVPMNRPANITKAMKAWIAKAHWILDPFREEDECWFHPSPPPARVAANRTLRPCGKIQKCFNWQDHRGKHAIFLNFGIVSKLLLNKLTKQQKDGFISKQWHLSHLCGNWTCLNPAHTTVEPGSVNISRNSCFSHRSGCAHTPRCMKDKKVALNADGKLLDLTALEEGGSSQASTGHVDWNDWRYGFNNEEELMVVDSAEEFDSTTASTAGDDTSMDPNE